MSLCLGGGVKIRFWLVEGSWIVNCLDFILNPDATVQDFLYTISRRHMIQAYDIDIWNVRCISFHLWHSVRPYLCSINSPGILLVPQLTRVVPPSVVLWPNMRMSYHSSATTSLETITAAYTYRTHSPGPRRTRSTS